MIPMEDETKNTASECNCICPECGTEFKIRNPFTDAKKIQMQCCKRCGFEWKSRTSKPLKCPKCGSYSWDKTYNTCTCSMCEHVWTARTENEPLRCPKCKSVKWNKSIQKNMCNIKEGGGSEQDIQEKWIIKKYDEDKGCFQIAKETGLPYLLVMDVIRTRTGFKSVRP